MLYYQFVLISSDVIYQLKRYFKKPFSEESRGVVTNVLDSDIIVSKFELLSRYNIYF